MAQTVSPITTTGIPTLGSTAPVAGNQAVPAAVVGTTNPTTFDSLAVSGSDFFDSTPVSGGGFGADIGSAVSRLTAFAANEMKKTQADISALFQSEGGPMDAAKLQVYTQKMSQYEMSMSIAAKIQEKEERAVSVWVR